MIRPACLFAITENPDKTNMDERLPLKDARRTNPENPVIPRILILTRRPPLQARRLG